MQHIMTLGATVNRASKLGMPPPTCGIYLAPQPYVWSIKGVARDSTGAALAGVTCTLFRVNPAGTQFDQEGQTVSGADGSYSFSASTPPPYTYRVTWDLPGSPTRAGISLYTLQAV